MSNLKQIGLGLMQYAQDYDETTVGPYYTDTAGTDVYQFNPQYSAGGKTGYYWIDAVFPYVKNEQLFLCPSDNRSAASRYRYYTTCTNTLCSRAGSYLINRTYNSGRRGETDATADIYNPTAKKLSQWVTPSTTVYLVENLSNQAAESSLRSNQGATSLSKVDVNGQDTIHGSIDAAVARHMDTTNVLFCDGHAKAMTVDALFSPKSTKAPTTGWSSLFTINDD